MYVTSDYRPHTCTLKNAYLPRCAYYLLSLPSLLLLSPSFTFISQLLLCVLKLRYMNRWCWVQQALPASQSVTRDSILNKSLILTKAYCALRITLAKSTSYCFVTLSLALMLVLFHFIPLIVFVILGEKVNLAANVMCRNRIDYWNRKNTHFINGMYAYSLSHIDVVLLLFLSLKWQMT